MIPEINWITGLCFRGQFDVDTGICRYTLISNWSLFILLVGFRLSDKLQKSPDDWSGHMDLLQRTLHQCPIDATWNLNKPHRQTGCRPSNCLAALLAYRMDHKNSLICSSRNKNQKAHCRCSRIRVPCDIRHLQDYLRPVFWNPEPIDQWFGKPTFRLQYTFYGSHPPNSTT